MATTEYVKVHQTSQQAAYPGSPPPARDASTPVRSAEEQTANILKGGALPASPDAATVLSDMKAAQEAAKAKASAAANAGAATPAAATTGAAGTAATASTGTASAKKNAITGSTTPQAQAIGDMYDAQRAAQLAELERSYNLSRSDAEAQRAKIDPLYQQKANDLSVQYERNRRNFNENAAGTGINSGTGSQAALAQRSEFQRDYGNLRTAQADALAEADRGLANLQAQYQSNVSAAIAENDYRKAAALLDEYNNQYQRNIAQAQALAKYGDFSGYATIYGAEAAKNMEQVWRIQNPLIAYNMGKISAKEYFKITGSYPAGYNPSGGGGGGGSYYAGGSAYSYKAGDQNGKTGGWDPNSGKAPTSAELARMSTEQANNALAAAVAAGLMTESAADRIGTSAYKQRVAGAVAVHEDVSHADKPTVLSSDAVNKSRDLGRAQVNRKVSTMNAIKNSNTNYTIKYGH